MQNVSNLFTTLFEKRSKAVEVRAIIGGEVYGMGDLYKVRITRQCFANDTPSVGGTSASALELSLVPRVRIPRMEEVKIETRITTDDGDASEWIPKGTFYLDTRETEADNERINFTAYDAILKAEQTYSELTAFDEWSQPDTAVAAEIASIMGVELDERTELAGYAVPYPNDYTMREVLGYIAAANGGNWTITDDNKLRLVKLAKDRAVLAEETRTKPIKYGDKYILLHSGAAADGETGIGRNVEAFSDYGKLDPFTGVKIWWSDEKAYIAGNDTGRVLELDCPWATQAMADSILAEIEGYAWRGAEATKAEISPAAELGDVVICDGVPFALTQLSVSFDGSYLPDIGAPGDNEIDYEYKYESKTQRELARRVTLGADYYGTSITREAGITVNRTDGDNIYSVVNLNSDFFKAVNSGGAEVLLMDFEKQKFQWNGGIVIPDGFISFSQLDTETQTAIETASDGVASELESFSEKVNRYLAGVDDEIAELQKALDSKIDTYYYDYVPTLYNIPASEWRTEEERAEHEGDLFYDKSTGYAYRFFQNTHTEQIQDSANGNVLDSSGGVILATVRWEWALVQDTDVTRALALAAAAQDTADSKRRVFLSTPTPPYDMGDLWEDGDELMTCINGRSSGVFAAADWEKLVNYTDDAKALEALAAAQANSAALQEFAGDVSTYLTGIDGEIIRLQGELDGKIDTYYYDYTPTLENAPASYWTTPAALAAHEGDMFYDRSTGYAYRFSLSTRTETIQDSDGGTVWDSDGGSILAFVYYYAWEFIQDADITKALSAASDAQDTADSKRRVFLSTPTPPYDVGDIWIQADGTLMTCVNARSSGYYTATDWQELVKYTDDTTATTALTAVQQIANGSYSGGTFIDGDNIYAPHIYGGATLNIGASGSGYNFAVDEYGNVTTAGNVTLGGDINITGAITWNGNNPAAGCLTDETLARSIMNGRARGTFINGNAIYSPEIYSNEFNVVTDTENEGSFNLYAKYEGEVYHFFAIDYYEGDAPWIHIYSPDGGYIRLGDDGKTFFTYNGTHDFTNARVYGLDNITAKFG